MHRAVALYKLKDLDGALTGGQGGPQARSATQAPPGGVRLGRILEAKGYAAGAREYMAPYLKLDPAPADVDLVQGHLENLGKQTGASGVEPDLEAL